MERRTRDFMMKINTTLSYSLCKFFVSAYLNRFAFLSNLFHSCGSQQVWKLSNQGNIVNLIDPTIYDSGMEDDILRYANVGLLCVQEIAADRPNISRDKEFK